MFHVSIQCITTEICRPAARSSSNRIHNPAIKNWAGRKVAYAVCILMQLRILKLNRKLVANDQPVVHGPPAYILTVTISTSFWKLAAKYWCQESHCLFVAVLWDYSCYIFFIITERIVNTLFRTLAFPLRHVFCINFSFNKNFAVKRKTCVFKGTFFSDCRKNYLGLVSCKWLLASWYSSFVNLDWKFCSHQLLKRWSV